MFKFRPQYTAFSERVQVMGRGTTIPNILIAIIIGSSPKKFIARYFSQVNFRLIIYAYSSPVVPLSTAARPPAIAHETWGVA